MIKQSKIYSFALCVMLLTGTTIALADDESQQGLYISGPSVGYYLFDRDNNNNAEDGFFYGLGAGYQFNKYFAIEANYGRLESEVKNSMMDKDFTCRLEGENLDVDMYHLNGIFNLNTNSAWTPYLAVGYTRLEQSPQFGDDDHDMMNLGLGVKRQLTRSLSLRGDVRAFHNFDNEDTDYAANIGLAYLFGAKASKPPEQPPLDPCTLLKDDDGDGVNNCEDRCAGTPVGSKVDVTGCIDPCSLDDDGDGVDNCKDRCAGTPVGSKIEVTGCRKLVGVEKIRLEVLFDTNKAIVKPDFFEEIRRVADFMEKYPSTQTEIQGHTDSRASEAHNQRLSQRRANAVREVLVNEFNISASRLFAVGYGESRLLVDPELTSYDLQKNRRVIAHIETVVEKVEESSL